MNLSPRKEPFKMTLGERGEIIAADYLAKQGYKILEKNFRCALGEIDIVAEKSGRLIFAEVKTRTSERFGRPEESVHEIKQRKIVRLAEWYLRAHKIQERPISFLVLAVDWSMPQEPVVRMIENAFQASEELS
jgi:putative endonuclease